MSLHDATPEAYAVDGNEPEGLRWFYGLLILHIVLAVPALLISEVIYDAKDWRTFPIDPDLVEDIAIFGSLAAPVVGLLTFANKRLVLPQKLTLLCVSFTGMAAMLYFFTQVMDAMRF
jgi:hypothetical protein